MSPIHNLSDIKRLPRLGKISLGTKAKTEKGVEYPKEVDYFVCPPQVQEVFGEKPTELGIMFPVENTEVFFPQYYKRYGYDLLKCKGTGQKAITWDEEHGGMKEIDCPCDELKNGNCRRVGILQFLLPEVPGAGVWQITTSSRNSIIDINSSIHFIKSICGRIRMIPLILKREEMLTQRIDNEGKPKKSKHYTLKIDLADVSLKQLLEYARISPTNILLPPPDESKDELFFPKEGFTQEEDSPNGETEEPSEDSEFAEEAELNDLRESLFGKVAEYEQAGGKVNRATNQRLLELKDKGTVEEIKAAIEHFKIEKEKLDKAKK